MNCEEARLLIGAEPYATAPELEMHVRQCEGCAQFRAEMRALDGSIRRAMEQPPPQPARARQHRPQPAWRQWTLAASVALALAIGVGVWLLRPSDSLARDVVAHVQGEPQSWFAKEHVSAPQIDQTLRAAGVQLDFTSDRIVYAHSCWFRGHYVPHLVVETDHGPATVLILRHEHVPRRESFHEAGMAGVIVPDEGGSIAVLTRGGVSVAELATKMQQDVRWVPGSH